MKKDNNKILTDEEFNEIINNHYSNEYNINEIPKLKYFSVKSYYVR